MARRMHDILGPAWVNTCTEHKAVACTCTWLSSEHARNLGSENDISLWSSPTSTSNRSLNTLLSTMCKICSVNREVGTWNILYSMDTLRYPLSNPHWSHCGVYSQLDDDKLWSTQLHVNSVLITHFHCSNVVLEPKWELCTFVVVGILHTLVDTKHRIITC